MKFVDMKYTVNADGTLTIPAEELREIGVNAGDEIAMTFVGNDHEKNLYHEFIITGAAPESEDETIRIPDHLLQEASMNGSDFRLVCIPGAILILREDALSPDELSAVMNAMETTSDIFRSLNEDPSEARRQLKDDLARLIEEVNNE